jgi:hypothetical protein
MIRNFLMLSIVTMTLLLQSTTAGATSLSCSNGEGSSTSDNTKVVIDTVRIPDCTSDSGRKYSLEMKGVGLGVGAAMASKFEVFCPGRSSPIGTYYGVKVDAAVLAQAGLAAFAGKNGMCFVGNLGIFALRVNVSISQLSITRVN